MNFVLSNNLFAENGILERIHNIIEDDGFSKPLCIIDEGFSSSDYWKKIEKNLQEKYGTFSIVIVSGSEEPSYDSLRNYLDLSRENECDIILGIGGGSCMDVAKAIGGLLTNSGDPLDFRGFDKVIIPGIPVYLAPTTAGTGSEASFNASLVDTDSNKKLGINGINMFARKSFLDGYTTISCPRRPAVGASVDAIVHAMEGYICKNSNIFSDMFAETAIGLLANSILDLNEDTPDMDKRLNLLKGAYLAGVVQMNSGSGIAAAISYPLSVFYKVPHGIGGGIFLLGIARLNESKGFTKYNNLMKLVPTSSHKNFLSHMEEIFSKLDVPSDLSIFNIDKGNKNHLCEIMQTQQVAFDQNPYEFSTQGDFSNFIDNYLT
jgi:alcohol dehydrogenase